MEMTTDQRFPFTQMNTSDGACKHTLVTESQTKEETTVATIYRIKRICVHCGADVSPNCWSQ
jgi:hypothetical protein